MALKLHTIISSTRPGRKGTALAQWFHEHAVSHGKFDCDLIDLAVFELPVFAEPKHPRFGDYEHEHTKKWSESVKAADAFVFVMPEYNHFAPPALVNALNYLSAEWQKKPAALVSYGGVSGGLRGAQSIKGLLASLGMMPIPEALPIPFFGNQIDANGVFQANENNLKGVAPLLDALHGWAEALKPMRG